MELLRLKRFWVILLLPLSLALVSLASSHPAMTERIYSRGIYPVFVNTLGRLFSAVPFSICEWLVLLLPLGLLAYIVRECIRITRRREGRRTRLLLLTANLCCLVGALYFVFTLLCGFNYHRESFAAAGGLTVRPSSTEELTALCQELTARAGELRGQVAEDSGGVTASSFDSYYQAAAFARTAYASAGEQYPALAGYTVRPKPVLFSRAMSYLDITGIYMPFTFESNVNVDVPSFWIPSTTMHELAHSKGYMREDEANFIAYLVCASSGNADFAYSGVMLALIHSTNALYSADRELYWQVREQFSDGLERDMEANREYWRQFEGPVAEVSTAVNDAYLRSNRQEAGVRSYGRMVDLLLAEYRQRHGWE